MASMRPQVTGIALAVLGRLGAILSCALPMWRVTSLMNSDIHEAEFVSEGLWKVCNILNTTQIQCAKHKSLLYVPDDLLVARLLVVTCIIVTALGLLFSVVGDKCSKWVDDETINAKIMTKAGLMLLMSGLWENSGEIQKMGASLYIGWAASVLLLLGGALLCCPRLPCLILQPHSADYSAPTVRSPSSSRDYVFSFFFACFVGTGP
uniref:Claudin n=2 Tax=Castor canadensis TaxID=51338 RepID=A0A8C0XW35_CASCN